jgi:hypothetical protein
MDPTLLTRIYRWLRNQKKRWNRWTKWPPLGAIDFGDLQRVTPVSAKFGWDRGNPIDRYYIERFLQQHSSDIRGRVLEIGDPRYTRQFGENRVTKSDVLHVNLPKSEVTIVSDLASADHIPSDSYDCLIITQTLQFIYHVGAAIKTGYRILKPGGVLLATFPGISKIDHPAHMEQFEDYWRFTRRAAQRIFTEIFPPGKVAVQAHGNVLAASSFLFGLAVQELRQGELDYNDPDYELLITVRAVKPESK